MVGLELEIWEIHESGSSWVQSFLNMRYGWHLCFIKHRLKKFNVSYTFEYEGYG